MPSTIFSLMKFLLLSIILFAGLVASDSVFQEIANKNSNKSESCKQSDESVNAERFKLKRIDPIEVNYTRDLHLVDGQVHKMVTQSILPPVFTVENFLTDDECASLIKKALDSGHMAPSQLHLDDKVLANKEYSKSIYNLGSEFKYWDLDNDGLIEFPDEIEKVAQKNNHLYLEEDEKKTILEKFGLDLDTEKHGRKYMSGKAFKSFNGAGLMEYFNDLREHGPRHRDRTSNQVWLQQDENDTTLKELWRKVQILTQLPKTVTDGGEFLQVVHYGAYGHYYAHYDSQDKADWPQLPCCHVSEDGEKCRICRYLTVLYFLNDVEEGGETAFPVSDMRTFNHSEFLERKDGDMYNLSKNCYKSKLVVKPKKGMAVFWYNHFMSDDHTLGPLDLHSLHGGCDVLKGEKWIANNWIPANEADFLTNISKYTPAFGPKESVNCEDK